jgi:CheY-like chemotaxis protein
MTETSRSSGPAVIFRCFPRADRLFERAVQQLVAEDPALDPRDADSAARLERRLREKYPGASVRIQDLLATLGSDIPLWYVYRRDNPHAPDESPRDEGEEAAGEAARPESPGGPGSRPIYSAAAAASMVGVPLGSIVGWDADGLIRASVTREGQNLYSRDDIDDLIWLKRGVTEGKSGEELRQGMEQRRTRRSRGHDNPPGGRRLLVLLAERDPYAAEYAEYFLRTEGYDVEVAFDVPAAQAAAAALAPDVVVVELLISGGSGAELCARLKAQGSSSVLAISSLDDSDIALRAGADAFLAKPLDPLQFVSTVKDLLGDSAMLKADASR